MSDEDSSNAVVEENDPGRKNEDSLEDVLNKNGLDPDFWIKKFQDLGITKSTQLQHADRSVLKELSDQKEFPWQENALKACFPSLNKSKQEQIDKMKERSEEKLSTLDKAMDETERSKKMQIKPEMPQSQRELHEKLTSMEIDKKDPTYREKISPRDLISSISAGRILRGYHLTKDVSLRVLPRKQLISLGDDVTILAPMMEEIFMSQEFFDEEMAEMYDHVVKHWGFSATLSVGEPGIFSTDIAGSTASTNEKTRENTNESCYTEIKETVTVPMASFVLENTPHFLSTEAVNELSKLEKNMEKENSDIDKLCNNFFQTFGSHYFAGTYHFGGRYTRSVICKTKHKMTKEESLTLTKSALQATAGGVFEWFSAGGGIKIEESKDESTRKFHDKVNNNVRKKIVQCGGPPETDSIPEWKLGLVKYPATWSIIDMDAHKNEWKGVWELLKNDLSSKIKNKKRLRKALKNAWENEELIEALHADRVHRMELKDLEKKQQEEAYNEKIGRINW
ncbi:interferon-induced very large GTPase 1-like [Crassostrea virginica]